MTPGSPLPILGSDVVDLGTERVRSLVANPRFPRRVLDPAERERLEADPDPARTLWAFWAAKEAAFKVATRLRGAPPVFRHRTFRVELAPPGASAAGPGRAPPLRGVVLWEHERIPVQVRVTEAWVHALAWSPGAPSAAGGAPGTALPPEAAVHFPARLFHDLVAMGPGEPDSWPGGLRERFTPREWRCVHRAASARCRLAARRAIARALEVEEGRLEIACGEGPPGRRPPLVLLDGRPAPVALTLSHHGRFVTWAFVLPEVPPG